MLKDLAQPAILAPGSSYGQSMFYSIGPKARLKKALDRISDRFPLPSGIFGIGEPLVRELSRSIPGLRTFPAMSGPGFSIPSTQHSLWIFLSGKNRTEVFDRAQTLQALMNQDFLLEDSMETFAYAGGRDLSGYEDGTENPSPGQSPAVALVPDGKGLSGSSFAGVQRWVHDLDRLHSRSPEEQDNIIGRKKTTNEELPDAPPSAHVKRSAQESFTPPATMLRRSMPWARDLQKGLEFVAFAHSLTPYERILRRMAGLDDGIADALFTFSHPVTGGFYWCPPVQNNRLDFSGLEE